MASLVGPIASDLVGEFDIPPDALGPELVVNGSFSADSGWTKGDGWTIGSGKADCDGTQAATSNLFQTDGITQFKTYWTDFELSTVTLGNLHYASGTTTGTDRSADGRYKERVYQDQVTGGNIIAQADTDFTGKLDNFSVRELLR